MKKLIKSEILTYFKQIIKLNIKIGTEFDIENVYNKYQLNENFETKSLDIGCGLSPQNPFSASSIFGIDLFSDPEKNIYKSRLGFEDIPFEDCYFDYVTAYDVLEHIPRYSDLEYVNHTPFIFLMNEIYRILKPNGLLLSFTPVYPYFGAFQDPTHNNIITVDTFPMYFSDKKIEIANNYGIKCSFKIPYQKIIGEHLITILIK